MVNGDFLLLLFFVGLTFWVGSCLLRIGFFRLFSRKSLLARLSLAECNLFVFILKISVCL